MPELLARSTFRTLICTDSMTRYCAIDAMPSALLRKEELVLHLFEGDPDEMVRHSIATRYADLTSEHSRLALLNFLKDEASLVRVGALSSLARRGMTTTALLLDMVGGEASKWAQAKVFGELTLAHGQDFVQNLIELTTDEDRRVMEMAVSYLAEIVADRQLTDAQKAELSKSAEKYSGHGDPDTVRSWSDIKRACE